MINLIQRQKDIIKILLNSYDYLTMKDISKILDVSTRTVLRDLKEIEKWFEENDFKLKIKTGVGLFIDEGERVRKYILELLNFEKIKIYSDKERKILIISSLLYTDEPIKMNYFIKKLDVSKTTFNEDIIKLIDSLNKFNLVLNKKPGIGCYLEGNEEDIRNCYLNIILEYFKEKELIECFKNIFYTQINFDFIKSNIILKIFDKEFLNLICECVDCNIKKLDFILSDESYIEFIIQLAISIKRTNQKNFVNIDEYDLNQFLNTEYFKIIKNICMDLEERFKIIFAPEEIIFLTKNLKSLKFIKIGYILDDVELLNDTKKLINLVEKDIKISLIDDKILLNDLLNHLAVSVHRIKLKLKIENPCLDEIKKEYSEIYESIKNNISFIENKFNIGIIPEEEIGYITLHFLVSYERKLKNVTINTVLCCHTGIGTSKILLKQIKEKFQNINVIEVIPSFKLKQYKNVDLIISTINLNTNLPFIKLNPILDYKNEKKLKQVIFNVARNKIIQRKQVKHTNLLECMQEKHMFEILNLSNDINNIINNYKHLLYNEILNLEDLLENLSEYLVENIEDKNILIKDLGRRINIQLPFFEEFDLLYLHCMSNSVTSIKVVTVKLKKYIEILEKKITFILVVIIPKNINTYQNQLVSEISINILNNTKFVDSIKYLDEDQILNIIKRFLLNFYKDKIEEIIYTDGK